MMVKSLSSNVDVRVVHVGSILVPDQLGKGFEVILPTEPRYGMARLIAVGVVEADGSIRRVDDYCMETEMDEVDT